MASSSDNEGQGSQPPSSFVEALSHLGYFLGHECDLLTTKEDCAKILNAFAKRLYKTKSLSWRQLSLTTSRRLAIALLGQEYPRNSPVNDPEEWLAEFTTLEDDIWDHQRDNMHIHPGYLSL